MRILGRAIALLAMLVGVGDPAWAALPLTVRTTTATVADPQNDTLPKAIPGATLDYTVSITSGTSSVSGIVYAVTIAPKSMLYVLDLGNAGGGPVVFNNGSVAGLGGTGLTYGYASLGSTTDQLDFSSDGGVTWGYTPVADGSGCDGQVTNIRIRPSGTQAPGTTFTLRYRVMVQ